MQLWGGGLNKNLSSNYKLLDYSCLSPEEKSEGYVFHILTDCISTPTQQKLNQLQDELSQIYPCKIEVHSVNAKLFIENCNVKAFRENHATCYRLLLASTLPKTLKTCLYLDVDMLCLKDLRMCFALDTKDKIIVASLIKSSPYSSSLKSSKGKKDYVFNPNFNHFNSGFMLINLKKWRKFKVEQKALWLTQNYIIDDIPDEMILNAILQPKHRLNMSLKFNFYIGFAKKELRAQITCLNESTKRPRDWILPFTENEIEEADKQAFILHFNCGATKPWDKILLLDCNKKQPLFIYYQAWWNTALTTPVFKDKLLLLKIELTDKKLKENMEQDRQVLLSQILNLNQTITKLENENKTLQNEITSLKQTKGAALRAQNQLAYKLGTTLMSYSKSKFFYLNPKFYLTLLSIKSRHKKSKKAYENLIFSNPSFKLSLLETYADYDEALKVQNFFSYRLGLEFIKASKTWYKGGYVRFCFEVKKLKNQQSKTKFSL
ncbi:hypothetical protein GW575_03970 [Campylobacter sp. MIT 19-121]|uniref:glycosyltransferase n=1 Tax=Campylobacter sp. MIT 19-121 TaxID=2703906 RepID=UPI0013897983|nr:hypothetical protein [Campylobacter sp. MIT 19-121]